MLFVINESSPVETNFHMHNVPFPLDMIFLDDEFKVIDVKRGNPEDDSIEGIASYVLEVNADSGIKIGDEADLDDDDEDFDDEDEDYEEGFDFGDEDSTIYEVECACGSIINFDEETLEEGSIVCPNCGETLEFSLEDEDEDEDEE